MKAAHRETEQGDVLDVHVFLHSQACSVAKWS
ncbi:MAG: hypothetical protein ACJATT_005077 [Myxococcota bacterium]